MEKITVYEATDSDDGHCIFTSLQDALDFIKYEIEGFPSEDLADAAEDELEFKITLKLMTQKEIDELPEYNP